MKKVSILFATVFTFIGSLSAQQTATFAIANSNETAIYATVEANAYVRGIDKYSSETAETAQAVVSVKVSASKEKITISTPNMVRKGAKIEVLDLTGVRIMGGKFGDDVEDLDISLLDNGMYNLSIVTPTASFSTRFVK